MNGRTVLASDTETSGDGVPVITKGEPSEGWHVATDAEIDAYDAYWTAACPVCGRERGEADFCPT